MEVLFRVLQNKKSCLFQLRKCFIQCHSDSFLSSVMVSNMKYFDMKLKTPIFSNRAKDSNKCENMEHPLTFFSKTDTVLLYLIKRGVG